MKRQKKQPPSVDEFLQRARKLRGAVRRTVWVWVRTIEGIHPPRSSPRLSDQGIAEDPDRWPPLPPRTPRWVSEFLRGWRSAAARDCLVVWPEFCEPDPLPPVTEGHRVAWSVWGSRDGSHRPYLTLVTPTHWAEVHVDSGGRRQVGAQHLGPAKQYASKQDALRAAHYSLCRHVAEAMDLSLRRAHGQDL